MTALLEVEELHVELPLATGRLHAVRGVNLTINPGEILCLVGESGCGKSLTALSFMNLLPSRAQRLAKRLNFDGTDLLKLTETQMMAFRGNRMAMIFQEPMTSLNPVYTIGDQLIEAWRRHRRVNRQAARDRAVYLLEKQGITAAARRLQQYPHQLSGGLRQRVMIAMALMCEPQLLIADEPTTALDVTIQAQILQLLISWQRELQMAMVLITHDLGVVARVADRVIIMYAGQVVETGTVYEIFQQPMHPYTQGLLACLPIPGKTPRGEHLGSIPGVVPSLIGKIPGCYFQSRCRYAQDICASQEIELTKWEGEHSYRCLLEPEKCLELAKESI